MAVKRGLTAGRGQRTSKGTRITDDVISAYEGDQSLVVSIGQDNSEIIAEAIKKQIAVALDAIGIQCASDTALITPVDTGRLRSSITHQLMEGGESVHVGTNVEYAAAVELGIGQKQQSYLVANLNRNGEEYRRWLKDRLESAPEPR